MLGVVAINEANSGTVSFTNPFESGVEFLATLAGPTSTLPGAGAPRVSVDVLGLARLTDLAPASNYVLSVRRHRYFNGRSVVDQSSATVNVSIHTPTLAATRPSAPVIRVVGPSGVYVVIDWAPSTDNVSTADQLYYTYSTNGAAGPNVFTCEQYCFGSTGAYIPRPPVGTSIRVTVTAHDFAGLASLPSNELVIAG